MAAGDERAALPAARVARNRRPARAMLASLALAAGFAAPLAPADAGELRSLVLQVDNDEFAGLDRHDRWYTSGLYAAAIFGMQGGGAAHRLLDAWCEPIHCAPDGEALAFVALGQNLYTQGERKRVALVPGDRPVGGWLYLRGGGVMDGPRRHDMVAFEIGITGPGALGRRTQDAMHDILDVERVPGWTYQLRPRTGVALRVQSSRRFPLGEASDLMAEGRLHLGNMNTHLGAGIGIRFGRALDGARLPAEASDAAPGLRSPAGWHGVVGLRARAVAFDGLVEGPTFGYSSTVRARPFVVEGFAGVGYRFRRHAEVMFTLSRGSADFRGDTVPHGSLTGHTIGAIRLGWQFGH